MLFNVALNDGFKTILPCAIVGYVVFKKNLNYSKNTNDIIFRMEYEM